MFHMFLQERLREDANSSAAAQRKTRGQRGLVRCEAEPSTGPGLGHEPWRVVKCCQDIHS